MEEEHSRGIGHVLWTRGTREVDESWGCLQGAGSRALQSKSMVSAEGTDLGVTNTKWVTGTISTERVGEITQGASALNP